MFYLYRKQKSKPFYVHGKLCCRNPSEQRDISRKPLLNYQQHRFVLSGFDFSLLYCYFLSLEVNSSSAHIVAMMDGRVCVAAAHILYLSHVTLYIFMKPLRCCVCNGKGMDTQVAISITDKIKLLYQNTGYDYKHVFPLIH